MSHGGSPFSVILIVQALLAQLLWKTINNKTTVRGWRYTSIPEFSQRGNKRRDCLCLLHRSRLNEGGMGKRLIGCRLCWMVTAAVFAGIVVIEALILVDWS
jgi:hypothetical protein